MITNPVAVSDMLVTVKAREIQRALVAEMRQDKVAATRHLLAAAHLELVLAGDYQGIGDGEMVVRSKISAASCFWRAGLAAEANRLFAEIEQTYPDQAKTLADLRAELARDYAP
jgi:hypothetical protein